MLRKLAALLVAFCLVSAGTAFAGVRAGSFSLIPQLGYMWFDDDVDLDDDLVPGIGVGYNFTKNIGIEALVSFIDSEVESSASDADVYLYKADLLYHFNPDGAFVPFIAAGVGGLTIDPDAGDSDTDLIADYGAGLKYFFTESTAFRGDVRHVIQIDDDTEHHILANIGLEFLFGGEKPKVYTGAAPKDSDGDGVYDYLDKCPSTPKGVAVDSNGCPIDSDGDGVPDYKDACPNTPKGVTVNAKGCPPDSDGDGVVDYLDKCPNTPRGVVVDDKGCPVDSDGDGVIDAKDKCPNTLPGVAVDADGCAIKETLLIEFDTNSAAIRATEKDDIKKAAAFVAKYPTIKIQVAGHTDSRGKDSYNQQLSERRAASVRQALIDQYKIKPNKLEAKGYGENYPVADNKTAEGRQRNRRVELLLTTLPK